MTAHDWFVEQRVDFTARALGPEDERTFRDHLPRCAECTAAVAELERDLAWLPMGAAPVAPRPGLRRALVDGVLGEGVLGRAPRRAGWRRALPAALPAALAAAAVLAALAVGGAWRAADRRAAALAGALARSERRRAAIEDTLSVVRQASRVLQANIEMNGRTGGLVIFADTRTHRWNVVVHGLPAAPPGERYQFWFITDDGMVRGAEIRPDGAPVQLTMGMPREGGTVLGAALSVEPARDTAGPPRGRMLAHLML